MNNLIYSRAAIKFLTYICTLPQYMLPGVEEIHQGEEQHNSQFPAEVFFLREKNVNCSVK